MRARTINVVHALLLSSAVVLATPVARAEPPTEAAPQRSAAEDTKRTEEARSRFNRGVELYRDGDYRAAVIEFRRAYELVPNWRIQYNLAQACAEIQDYPCTLRALQTYLDEGGSEVPADRRAAVEAELERVSKRIARVTIEVNRPDAEVFADETSLGKVPLPRPVLISAGRRRLVAMLPSGRSIAKVIEVAGGDELTVSLEFEPTPERIVRPVVEPPPERPARPSAAPIVIGLVATGVLAAGTLTTGLMSLSAQSDLDRELDTFPGSSGRIASERSKVETLGLVTDVLGAATIVAAGVTVYLVVTRPSKNVTLAVGPASAGFVGSF